LPGAELRLDGVAEAEGPSPSRVVVPATPATVQALAPGRYKVQFTASTELRDKLERLRALMRSSVPDGDLAAVVEAAVTEKLERLEARRFARTKSPRKGLAEAQVKPYSRHIPAAVRRAVHERDGNRCRFADEQGRRCTARDGLEYHHRHPFALGGDHSADGVSLLCRTHNQHLAEVDLGRRAMASHRRSKRSTTGPPGLQPQA
jgi:5-methylcytosine-specific restriction endonuclease McrA